MGGHEGGDQDLLALLDGGGSCGLKALRIPTAGTPVVPHPIGGSPTTISPLGANRVSQIGCVVGKWEERVRRLGIGGVTRMKASRNEVHNGAG